MSVAPVDLAALGLACWAALNVWFDENSILSELRARTQLWNSWFWRTLFNCRFCMSYWAPLGPLGLVLGSLFCEPPWAVVVKLPVYGLAATALVGLLDRLTESGGAATNATPKEDDVRPDRDPPSSDVP